MNRGRQRRFLMESAFSSFSHSFSLSHLWVAAPRRLPPREGGVTENDREKEKWPPAPTAACRGPCAPWRRRTSAEEDRQNDISTCCGASRSRRDAFIFSLFSTSS